MIIAGLADVTFLVCAAGRTSMGDVTRAVEQLRQVEAPLAGAILNGAGPESAYGGKYGYEALDAPGTPAGTKPARPKPAPRAAPKPRPEPRAKVATATAKATPKASAKAPAAKPAKPPRAAKPRPPARTQTK
jgi:hypothetical protein